MATNLSPAHSATVALPSEGVRTAVSLALFVHLFALGTVLFSNAAKSLTPDEFENERNRLSLRVAVPFLTPYMQYLFQNEASNLRNYRLTHDEYIDVDYQVFFDLKLKDGSTKTVVLPPEGLWPGQRQRRMQALANRAGQYLVLEALGRGDENILPAKLAQQIVPRYGATGGTIRIRGHRTIEPRFVFGTDQALADPFNAAHYATTYRANILVSPRTGTVRLQKITDAAESAPAARRGHATPSAPPVPTEPLPPQTPTAPSPLTPAPATP